MANQDLLLHDAKNCLHVLTVNLEAMEDGLIPLNRDTLFNLNQTLLAFRDILLQLVRDIASATSAVKNTVKTTTAAKPSTHDFCRRDAHSQPLKSVRCKEETSPRVPTKAAFNIVPVMRRLIKETAPLFHKRKISFSFEIKPAEVWVHADPASFERMLRNLFSNEEKYVFSGGRVVGTLEMEAASQACITLIDNGPGINPAYLKNIFNRSQRGCVPTSKSNSLADESSNKDSAVKATEIDVRREGLALLNENNTYVPCKTSKRVKTEIPEGSGLGLYQVAQTMASMGGSVEVHNCATGGLKTVLSFPVDAFLA